MIESKRKLHLEENNPISIIKNRIVNLFPDFKLEENLSPIVSIEQNFDSLGIPKDHVSRSKSDSYYLDEKHLLRTHTSAHQVDLLSKGYDKFLVVGDVYRRDEINKTHYPIFHQMEGVCLCDNAEKHLQQTIELIVTTLFPDSQYKLVDSYFPFTSPSYEVEVFYNDSWLEILGCGVIENHVLENAGVKSSGWAFGLGLERIAMILFDIPDIRLFWSEDNRFKKQFKKNEITKFEPFSKYPLCYKDIAFYVNDDYSDNNFYELVRNTCGNLVESIELLDKFVKMNKTSLCYRLNYRSFERSLSNEEINDLQQKVRDKVLKELNVQLR